jgi:hypothetical protein
MKRILILVSLLILTACTAATGSPTPTPSPSPAPPVTFTPMPTNTPSPTVTSTPADGIPDAPIFNGYLLTPYDDPECQLPCWQGLVIGESGRDDVQETFARLTQVDGYDFFEDFEVEDHTNLWIPDSISLDRAAGFEWYREPGVGLHFLGLIAIMDENEKTLEGLAINTGGDSLTPQEVFVKLGAPSLILVFMQQALHGVSFPMRFVYPDKGLVIFFTMTAPSLPLEEADGVSYATYCLNDPHNGSGSNIVAPFDDLELTREEIETLPPVFRDWVGYGITGGHLRAIEAVTGLTMQDIVDRVMSEENACLDIQTFY